MSKTKQILQLLADGNSQRRIATTLAVSRNTVVLYWQLRSDPANHIRNCCLDETTLYQTLFQEKAAEPVQVKPDFEWIHKDLLKDGVTLTSLWEKYCDACRAAKTAIHVFSVL